jgi:hypothetical protein
MGKIAQILGVLWQLPQFALGWLVEWYYRIGADYIVGEYNGVRVVYSMKMEKGVSFGRVIILPYKYRRLYSLNAYARVMHAHEYGHCVQSRKYGWLYLFVIGIPSAMWNWAHENIDKYEEADYYSFWTEKNANELGGAEV